MSEGKGKFNDCFIVVGESVTIKKDTVIPTTELGKDFMAEFNGALHTMEEIRRLESDLKTKKNRYPSG